jgi:hypothetical protein
MTPTAGKVSAHGLIECLVNAAHDNGISTFEANVSAKNDDI